MVLRISHVASCALCTLVFAFTFALLTSAFALFLALSLALLQSISLHFSVIFLDDCK